jgi:hypothetical protein
VSDVLTFLILLAAAACGGTWWLRRRRADALIRELGRALALAADAQQVCWRLDRRYADELSALARVRRELAPFIEGSIHAGSTRWELGASEDGSNFDLAILAVPVWAPLRLLGRRRKLGYERLLTAHGDHGVIAYDSFAEDRRYLPRAQLASVRP